MLLIAFILNAKNNSDLQNKFQQAKEKISKITQRTMLLSKLSERQSLNLESHLKSAATRQKLDSTVYRVLNAETQLWQNDYKDEYLYDAEMKNTAWIEKEWNLTTKTWNTWSKTDLEYDNQNRVSSMLMYDRDSLSQVLKQVSKILVFYNSEGMQDSSRMNSTEDGGVTWVLDMKQVNHYNVAKQLIKTDVWSWDDDLGKIMLSMNIANTYTASGKISTSAINMLFEGNEIPYLKSEYKYDGSGKLTSIEYSTFNPSTFSLEKSSRITYQYNASGMVSVEINSTWNGTSWVDEDKTAYEYNPAGDVSVESFSTWNGTAWIDKWKDEYTFGTTNFSELAFPQIEFITDVFSSFLNLFGIQESTDFSFNKIITGINSFEIINGSWKNTEKTAFYYSGGSTNINEFENSVVSVYPNPASESINFSWKGNNDALSLQVYQITGAKVIDQIVYSGRAVSISHLENGVYLYKLLNGQQNVKTGKMIKR